MKLLAFESTQSRSAPKEGSEHGWSVHYIHEADSFVPLVQVRQARAIALNETTDAKALMEANGGVYDTEQDPLWNGEQRNVSRAFDRKEMAFYQYDHLVSKQAQSGMDTYPGTPRAAELAKVKVILETHQKAGTNPAKLNEKI